MQVAMLNGIKCWPYKNQYIHKMSIVERRNLKWISKNTLKKEL